MQKSAVVILNSTENRGYLIVGVDTVQLVMECASSESYVTSVAVNVEAVDVAVFKIYVVYVIITENPPLRLSHQVLEGAVPYII